MHCASQGYLSSAKGCCVHNPCRTRCLCLFHLLQVSSLITCAQTPDLSTSCKHSSFVDERLIQVSFVTVYHTTGLSERLGAHSQPGDHEGCNKHCEQLIALSLCSCHAPARPALVPCHSPTRCRGRLPLTAPHTEPISTPSQPPAKLEHAPQPSKLTHTQQQSITCQAACVVADHA